MLIKEVHIVHVGILHDNVLSAMQQLYDACNQRNWSDILSSLVKTNPQSTCNVLAAPKGIGFLIP